MNRTDRLYALVEELRAAGLRGRTARQSAAHFEVSVRTVERDLSALGQAGVPLSTKQGRGGGFTIDRSMSLPPLNFTPREAAAVAVALSRSEHVLFTKDARSALQKIMAAMPERALDEARVTAEKVRLLVQPVPDPDAEIAETIWRAVRKPRAPDPLHRCRRRRDSPRGRATARRGRPQRLLPDGLVPPAGDDRVFRMERITEAERSPRLPRPRPVPEPVVDGHETKLPASVLRPENLLANSDIGLSRTTEMVGSTRRGG